MYKPRRDQLASFLPTQELIRAFEQLFDAVSTSDEATIASIIANLSLLSNTVTAVRVDLEGVSVTAGTADAKANSSNSELARIADALEILALAPVRTSQDADDIVLPSTREYQQDFDYIDLNPNGQHVGVPARMAWNTADDTLDIHHTGGVTQQVGLEHYLRFQNNTGSTITNGSSVGLEYIGGVTTNAIVNYLADGSAPTLNIVGITTQDVLDGEYGRITVWGRVRDLDTTGTPYGEIWIIGDVLYASPVVAGGMTNVKPTTPDVCVPLAIVVFSHATLGAIFVRPTIEQQLYYGSFNKTSDQSPAVVNTAYEITWDGAPFANGVTIGSPSSRIVAEHAGFYQFNASFQLTSSSASVKNVWLWYRKNGTDVADSSLIVSLDSGTAIRAPARSMSFSLAAGDYIELMFASDSTNMTIDAIAATAFAPAAPAAILTVNMEQQ